MSGVVDGAPFTIELPSVMKAQAPDQYGTLFELRDGDRNLVASVKIEKASPETSFDSEVAFQLGQGHTLLHKEAGTSTYSYVSRTVGKESVDGDVVLERGGTRVRCHWYLPARRIKGDTLEEWPVLERACESIKVTSKAAAAPATSPAPAATPPPAAAPAPTPPSPRTKPSTASHTKPTTPAASPKIGAKVTHVDGNLPREIVSRVVNRSLGALRACTATAPTATATVRFVIDRSGAVKDVHASGANAACLTRAVTAMAFPAPSGGGANVELQLAPSH
jgi:hypothetical protein